MKFVLSKKGTPRVTNKPRIRTPNLKFTMRTVVVVVVVVVVGCWLLLVVSVKMLSGALTYTASNGAMING